MSAPRSPCMLLAIPGSVPVHKDCAHLAAQHNSACISGGADGLAQISLQQLLDHKYLILAQPSPQHLKLATKSVGLTGQL